MSRGGLGKRTVFLTGALAGAAGALTLRSYRACRADMAAAEARIARERCVIATSQGEMIYGEAGDGPPVLMIHGSGGGFNQALHYARRFGGGFWWIAPSRFGYLGTPLPDDASPAAQADAFAALLDALKIARAPLIALSAGGPSALQFALRHPDRCAGLVMLSAVSKGMIDVSPNPDALIRIFDALLASDYLVWAALQLVRRGIAPPMGVPRTVVRSLSPAEKRWLETWLQNTLPVYSRRAGWVNDYHQILHLELLPLERIAVPVLILHAEDDSLVTLERHARFCAETIPDARLVTFPSGGHLLLGQGEGVRDQVRGFLTQNDENL
jgi:pimeloyl-ACP methyl ester carboxylesterase